MRNLDNTLENLENIVNNFDFNLLFNSSECSVNYFEPQDGFDLPETTTQLEGLRKLKNDWAIAAIEFKNRFNK